MGRPHDTLHFLLSSLTLASWICTLFLLNLLSILLFFTLSHASSSLPSSVVPCLPNLGRRRKYQVAQRPPTSRSLV